MYLRPWAIICMRVLESINRYPWDKYWKFGVVPHKCSKLYSTIEETYTYHSRSLLGSLRVRKHHINTRKRSPRLSHAGFGVTRGTTPRKHVPDATT